MVSIVELVRSFDVFEGVWGSIGFEKLIYDINVVKILVVGVGMCSYAGVAFWMFDVFAVRGINVLAITTSEIKVFVLIYEDYIEFAVWVFYIAYGFDVEDAAR